LNLVGRWRGRDLVPVQDMTELQVNWAVHNAQGHEFPGDDMNQVTSGSFTVGDLGDFASWGSAVADIGSPLDGNLSFMQTSDTVETSVTMAVPDLGGFVLTFVNGSPHHGDPTIGWKSVLGLVNYVRVVEVEVSGAGGVEVNGLQIRGDITGQIDNTYGIRVRTDGPSVDVHDCIVDFSLMSGARTDVCIYLVMQTVPSTIDVWNCEVMPHSNAFACGFRGNTSAAGLIIENCTSIFGGFGFHMTSTQAVIRNCDSFYANVDFMGVDGADGFNNVSSDTSAADPLGWSTTTSSIDNQLFEDNYYSHDISSDDFMLCIPSSVCAVSGMSPAIAQNDVGIRGNDRPHGGLFTIGSDEAGFPSLVASGTGGSAMSAMMSAMAGFGM